MNTRHHIILAITLISFTVIGCRLVHADDLNNFADRDAKQDKSVNAGRQTSEKTQYIKAEDLTDEDIQNILVSEGIPLTGNLGDNYSSESRYTLGADDVIAISVMRHPEVSGNYQINSEGKIQYDFVGDVEIAGLTKNEVRDKIQEILSKYIISPEVNVKIAAYNSKIVYVIGEVGSPGRIFMRGDTITVREALVDARLPLLSAKSGAARLVTPSADGSPEVKKVDVHKLLVKGDLRENLVMKPGDVLYLPPTFFAKAMRVIQPVAAPVNTSLGTGRNVQQGF